MATPNFRSMLYNMPLVCGIPFSEYWEEYDHDEFMAEVEANADCAEAQHIAEDFNDDLTFHTVTIIAGHYDSFQFFVEEKYSGYFDLDKSSRWCIDNDNAHYYFDMCRSLAIRKADSEKRRIMKWLYQIAEKYGYNICGISERFSNGETWYCKLN